MLIYVLETDPKTSLARQYDLFRDKFPHQGYMDFTFETPGDKIDSYLIYDYSVFF